MNYRMTGLIVVSISALAIGIFINQHSDVEQISQQPQDISLPEANPELSNSVQPDSDIKEGEQSADVLSELGASLKEKFGPILNNPKIQIRALEKIIQELKRLYGSQWQDHIEAFIRANFPEMAEQLLARYQNLMAYNEWALEQRFEIANMSEMERRQYMWDKRMELFGEDAQIIWQGQLRSERVQDVLVELGNTDLALDEKIDLYKMQLNDIYQEDAEKALDQHRQEFVDHFLSVETVQADLHNLPQTERRQQLKKLRQAMGMDKAALSRWEQLDEVRDQRWRVGKEYQTQRTQLMAKYQGDELDKQIQILQQQLFGEEAEIIRNEEISGYYRYEGQQHFGLN